MPPQHILAAGGRIGFGDDGYGGVRPSVYDGEYVSHFFVEIRLVTEIFRFIFKTLSMYDSVSFITVC